MLGTLAMVGDAGAGLAVGGFWVDFAPARLATQKRRLKQIAGSLMFTVTQFLFPKFLMGKVVGKGPCTTDRTESIGYWCMDAEDAVGEAIRWNGPSALRARAHFCHSSIRPLGTAQNHCGMADW